MRQWFKYWHVHGLGKKEKKATREYSQQRKEDTRKPETKGNKLKSNQVKKKKRQKVTRERSKGRKGNRGNNE